MSDRPLLITADITAEDLRRCTRIFEAIGSDLLILDKLTIEERNRLLIAVGRALKPDQLELRKRSRANRQAKNDARRAIDRKARAATTIRVTRDHEVYIAPRRLLSSPAPAVPDLATPDHCYICKTEFTKVHHFYDSLCPSCGDLNYEKRFQSAPLHGKTALITGARLKIGYQAALMLLRAGARVIVTTRFPHDAAVRYAGESDFPEWQSRLSIYGLDLRHSPSVETFTRYINQTEDRLDFLINNAAQTVRRPPGFYAHLLAREELPIEDLPPDAQSLLHNFTQCKSLLLGSDTHSDAAEGTKWISEWHRGKESQKQSETLGIVAAAHLSQIPYSCDDQLALNADLFPEGKLDADLQQVDLRSMNSWRMKLADVPTAELLEVQLVNSIAPFILCAHLKPLMLRHPTNDKHIVNVSAMEGKFARHTKTDRHPHTNMAKAALNMMTLTSARDYVKDGIYMNAVDTGWVTDEDPAEQALRKVQELDFQPPLDIVDGAARVLDPIFSGLLTGKHSWGNFLKDYAPTEW